MLANLAYIILYVSSLKDNIHTSSSMQSSLLSSGPGVYSIVSMDNPGVLYSYWQDRSNNSAMLGTLIPWNNTTTLANSEAAFVQLWLLETPNPTTPGVIVYTMRNLSTDKPASNTSDHWTITPHPSGFYRITNKRFGRNRDIETMLNGYTAWPMKSQMYIQDQEYLVLSQGMLREIWKYMTKHNYRQEIYDENDLAIAFKSAVAKWGVRSNIAFFCAFMTAGPNPSPRTLNSYIMTLSSDHKQLLFMK
ncbi:hypothetical protein DFJ58DRAFT_782570 [Suillus subalutaceus]|uniref:uncharacterized protein n=1 Tax=Suillus subalutaceus TaxID=48586 RepID=UPI001B87AAC0|nr:uncharacterized protein DFJ58DRAFT_782570 [Suillus subalutaceus]KAG1858035.1 hypothetical protein DFJ58DRAFT_782570 [Suillus subalutaceus]